MFFRNVRTPKLVRDLLSQTNMPAVRLEFQNLKYTNCFDIDIFKAAYLGPLHCRVSWSRSYCSGLRSTERISRSRDD